MLEGLNPEQREAVSRTEGPLLLVAGAGTGKTRVLTTRVAHLILDKDVEPGSILAFTFTNKAANQMKERVARYVPGSRAAWIGTFHATCVRILRREAEHLGFPVRFSIYDADDSRTLIKNVLKEHKADPKQFSPRAVSSAISRLKNQLISPQQALQDALTYPDEKLAGYYAEYQKRLAACHAFDFDDLIGKTVELMETHRDVQQRYSQRFRYVLVDEFQDTNPPQLVLIKALSATHRNLFAVGDDDQSIYSWRGATLENMLRFEDYFPGTVVLRLERNYRSTPLILRAANSVIAHNEQRRGKNLWNEGEDGHLIELRWASDEEEEASIIRERVAELCIAEDFSRKDVVVLYRTNAQSRALEDAFRRANVPYEIVGGVRFYERKEVRDLLAYLKLVNNPADRVSLDRIINVPRRGIGKTTVERWMTLADERGVTPLELAKDLPALTAACGNAGAKKVLTFTRMLGDLRRLAETQDASRVLNHVLHATSYEDWLVKNDPETAEDRLDNVAELVNAAHAFVGETDEGRLDGFLESVALLADVDSLDASGDSVTLMTLHNAKGLEYPVVAMAGCEDGLLPHANSTMEHDKLEEERRLFYVGITRAERRLILTAAHARRRFGGLEPSMPSRFLKEVPEDCLEEFGQAPGWMDSVSSWQAHTADRWGRVRPKPQVIRRRRPPTTGEPGVVEGAESLSSYGVDTFKASRARRSAAGNSGFEEHEINQDMPQGFAAGMRVAHASLGEGVVERVEGMGDLTKLTIEFDEGGSRKILAKYARLSVLD